MDEFINKLEDFIESNYIWEEEENYKIINVELLLDFIEEEKIKGVK